MVGPRLQRMEELARHIDSHTVTGKMLEGEQYRDLAYLEVMRQLDNQVLVDPRKKRGKKIAVRDFLFQPSIAQYLNAYPFMTKPEAGKADGLKALTIAQAGSRALLFTRAGWVIAQEIAGEQLTIQLTSAEKHISSLYAVFKIMPADIFRRFHEEIDYLLMRIEGAARLQLEEQEKTTNR